MDYDYSRKGNRVSIKPGAHAALVARGWERGVSRKHDGEAGVIAFEFGDGTDSHHIAVTFDDGEQVGFPPDMVEILGNEAPHIQPPPT